MSRVNQRKIHICLCAEKENVVSDATTSEQPHFTAAHQNKGNLGSLYSDQLLNSIHRAHKMFVGVAVVLSVFEKKRIYNLYILLKNQILPAVEKLKFWNNICRLFFLNK